MKIEPAWVDDVIMGQSYQNWECANGYRMALLDSSWPYEIYGVELDCRFCSGLGAVVFGSLKIRTKDADIVVAGGMESKTHNFGSHKRNIPFRIRFLCIYVFNLYVGFGGQRAIRS